MKASVTITRVAATDHTALLEIRRLFEEYARSLDVDLCFQNFEQELGGLPGDYQAPDGILLLAYFEGKPAGCCALRRLKALAHPNTAEMKRLYVRPEFRGKSIGHELVERVLKFAINNGYTAVALDTLKSMSEARALYVRIGFHEIGPYYDNPNDGTTYMKLELSNAGLPQE